MPSAASVKVDKQITSESSLVDANNSQQQNTPIRQALVIIEHKIRNLEKRKVSFNPKYTAHKSYYHEKVWAK